MSKNKDLFDLFGQVEFGITLPAENTLEENARVLAEHHSKNILPGHGFSLTFLKCQHIESLGWTLDYDGSFLRKPEPADELYYTYWEEYN